MSVGTRHGRQTLGTVARLLADAIAPACHAVHVAGSLRRGLDTAGDIDLVAVPEPDTDLFNRPKVPPSYGGLDLALDQMAARGMIRRVGGGPKLKKLELTAHPWPHVEPGERAGLAGVAVQLWCVPPEALGVALVIRTGPAEFSKRFVTPRHRGGLLRDDAAVRRNRVWQIYREGHPQATYRDDVVGDGNGGTQPAWVSPLDTPDEEAAFRHAGISYTRPEDRA